jgi:hypothetical protein
LLLLRDDEDVAAHLHPSAFQAFALEQVPVEHRVDPNTGVWLLRSCQLTFAFLNAVDAAGADPEGRDLASQEPWGSTSPGAPPRTSG